MQTTNRHVILAGVLLLCVAVWGFSDETNAYHFERTFEPVPYEAGQPSLFLVVSAVDEFTAVVQGNPELPLIVTNTYATEYEGMAWGYENSSAAWTSAVSVYSEYSLVHSNVVYDNAGWVKGTRQAEGDWGAFVWHLQNHLVFNSSTSSFLVMPSGETNAIASVLVGTLGDYEPNLLVANDGPVLDTTFLGEGNTTSVILRAETTVYYKMVRELYRSINDDDSDNDSIPDYADGYSLVGGDGRYLVSSNDCFTWCSLFLSLYATNPAEALLRFDYSASDPLAVSVNGTNYSLPSGHLRLWTGQKGRSGDSVGSSPPGDYIPTGTYSAASFGFSEANRKIMLYVEPTSLCAGQYITVSLDPDGTNGPQPFVTMDKWEMNNVSLSLSCSEATNTPKRFEFGENLYDICGLCFESRPTEGEMSELEHEPINSALTIYYKDVINKQGEVQPFTISLELQPDISNVQWSVLSSPGSGALSNANQAVATFVSPTNGGCYVFDLDIDGHESRLQAWLPVAGPDISHYWTNEVQRLKDWGVEYRTNLHVRAGGSFSQAMNPVGYAGLKELKRTRDFFRFGLEIDWYVPPGTELYAGETPCGLGNFSPTNSKAGDRDRFTMCGHVVDFAKRSNMGYAVIAKEAGFPDYWVLEGPNHVHFLQSLISESPSVGTRDTEYAKESYRAGIDLFNGLSLETVINNRGVRMLDPNMRAAKEWPSYESTTAGLLLETNTWAIMESLAQ